MPPPFGRRTTEKAPRRSPGRAAALEVRIEEIMDRVHHAGDNQVEQVAALEEYLTLAAPTKAASVLPVRARPPVRRNSAASGPGRTGEHR